MAVTLKGNKDLQKELTVIIPIYNDREHLGRCLGSIEKANNNQIAKILIIDDGSNCKYDDIISDYNLDISISKNDKNMGVGYSRNKGRKLAPTEWFSFVDADDYITEIYFDEFLKARNDAPDSLMYVFPVNTINFTDEKMIEIKKEIVYGGVHFGGNFYNKNVFEKYGMEIPELRLSEDICTNELLKTFNEVYHFIYANELEQGQYIYVWEHTNKDSTTWKSHYDNNGNGVKGAFVYARDFIAKFCEENPNSEFAYHCKKNNILTAYDIRIDEETVSEFYMKLSDSDKEDFKMLCDKRAEFKTLILNRLKYIELSEPVLEELADIHMMLWLNTIDKSYPTKYWYMQYREEPKMSLLEMQRKCDKIRVENATNALMKDDYSYISDIGMLDIFTKFFPKFIKEELKNNSGGGTRRK